MTWAEYKAEVLAVLAYEGQRTNYADFFNRQIRFAVLDMQRFIGRFREGHQSYYTHLDATTKGKASIVTLPAGSVVTSARLDQVRSFVSTADGSFIRLPIETTATGAASLAITVWSRGESGETIHLGIDAEAGSTEIASFNIAETGVWESHAATIAVSAIENSAELFVCRANANTSTADISEVSITSGTYSQHFDLGESPCDSLYGEQHMVEHDWERREEFICGDMRHPEIPRYAAKGKQLWLYPALNPETGGTTLIEWTGKKLNFLDADEVPFTEESINAAALYVRGKMLALLDGQHTEGWKLMNTYEKERGIIMSDFNLE